MKKFIVPIVAILGFFLVVFVFLDGYRSVYTNKLKSILNSDIHYWYGTKEAFAAKPQVKHLKTLSMNVKVQIFDKINHGQLLIDHPDQIAK